MIYRSQQQQKQQHHQQKTPQLLPLSKMAYKFLYHCHRLSISEKSSCATMTNKCYHKYFRITSKFYQPKHYRLATITVAFVFAFLVIVFLTSTPSSVFATAQLTVITSSNELPRDDVDHRRNGSLQAHEQAIERLLNASSSVERFMLRPESSPARQLIFINYPNNKNLTLLNLLDMTRNETIVDSEREPHDDSRQGDNENEENTEEDEEENEEEEDEEWEVKEKEQENEEIILTLPFALRATATVVCVIVLFFGVTGNVLVPLVVCRTKELSAGGSTNVFLVNLSIADLLILIVCMPTVLIELHSKPEVWTLGQVMCKAVPFVELVVAHGSILTILAISFERYYVICHPLKASYKCTVRRALMTIIALWSIAFCATIPVLFGTEYELVPYIDGSTVSVCSTKATSVGQKIYFHASMTAFFWIPLLVLVVIYVIIIRSLLSEDRAWLLATVSSSIASTGGGGRGSSSERGSIPNIRSSLACVSINSGSFFKEFGGAGGNGSTGSGGWPGMILWRYNSGAPPNSRNGSASAPSGNNSGNKANKLHAEKATRRTRRQVVWMLVAVVVCFFTCLLPFRLFTIWVLTVEQEEVRRLGIGLYYSLLYFCRIMLYVNSMLNPFLYAVVSSKFRTALVDTICQYCCYCNDYCYCDEQSSNRLPICCCYCCGEKDDLLDDFQKGMGPKGKMRRRYRRNRRFLLRQSTFNTTTTTTTSNSMKSSSQHGASQCETVKQHAAHAARFSSMDSILAQHALRMKPPLRHCFKQHSFDLEIGNTASITANKALQMAINNSGGVNDFGIRRISTPIMSKQSSIDSSASSSSSSSSSPSSSFEEKSSPDVVMVTASQSPTIRTAIAHRPLVISESAVQSSSIIHHQQTTIKLSLSLSPSLSSLSKASSTSSSSSSSPPSLPSLSPSSTAQAANFSSPSTEPTQLASETVSESLPSSSSLPTINLTKQVYTAQYLRANMMKRSSRVAIIDETGEHENGEYSNHYHSSCCSLPSSNDHNNLEIHDQKNKSEEVIIPNIEEILSDPQFSTYESYV